MTALLSIANGRLEIVESDTGELLDIVDVLDADRDTKASLYGQLTDLSTSVGTLRTQLKDALEELHHTGEIESAQHYGGVKLTRSSSRRWDPKRVGALLDRLVAEEVVAEARAAAAAPTVEVRKPDGRKLNTLLQELAGTEAGKDLASTKTDNVRWEAVTVDVPDIAPVAEQDPAPAPAAPLPPVPTADAVDEIFEGVA